MENPPYPLRIKHVKYYEACSTETRRNCISEHMQDV